MSLRLLAKTMAAETLCRTGAPRLWSGPTAQRSLVLGYHQVVEDVRNAGPSIPAMVISTAMLEKQLEWVGRHFRFVSLDELGRQLESGGAGERPLAAVTFDDGYRDVYEHAFPLLQRMGIPGAVFVVTDLVGTDRLMMHDRVHLLVTHLLAESPSARARLIGQLGGAAPVPALAEIERQRPRDAFPVMRALLESARSARLEQLVAMLAQAGEWDEEPSSELRVLDWDMVRTMHRAGFTIGSHTATHALLTLEAPDRVRQELSGSRKRLEDELGAPVRHLAYPDGRFDGAVVDAVAEAGYRFAYTICRHRDRRHPLLSVPRRLLWENSCRDSAGRFSPSLMRGLVGGVFDWFSRCRQDHRAASVPRPQGATA
jgi:peptidoglycan/xylan/chitin deacetylase (PgdA/CDA1 family)